MTTVLLFVIAGLALLNLIVAMLRGGSTDSAGGTSVREVVGQIERATDRSERAMRDELSRSREEATTSARQAREELAHPLQQMRQTVDMKLGELQASTTRQLELMRVESKETNETTRENLIEMVNDMLRVQRDRLADVQQQLAKLTESNEQRFERMTLAHQHNAETLRNGVESALKNLREDNTKQLEQMRLTVDEKLQGTLEKRIGESFRLVSDRLEQVHKGLGEMQALATGVGDLKKVLTNVKTRGTWGELQLKHMLDNVLSPAQYQENVSTKGNNERVEFVIKMPGRSVDDEPVLLPIDAKFPVEDYRRLVEAYESGDKMAEVGARQGFENRLKACAREISEKYINVPTTTDFAILYLPSEALFAEAMRNPEISETLQRVQRVVFAGPTTLYALLNSLQMGFRTLALQKRSSEVWSILGAVKTEWGRYGEMLKKVQKKLAEATNVVTDAETRSRAVGRKLLQVEGMPSAEASAVLLLDNAPITSVGVDESDDSAS